jgi:hypothetical protein
MKEQTGTFGLVFRVFVWPQIDKDCSFFLFHVD